METKKVILGSALPGALTPPVMDDGAEETMWKVLQRFGLVGKKLSVYKSEDARSIAEQVCHELGWICDSSHEDVVRSWLCRSIADEPYQRRLRNDHRPESLQVSLESRTALKSASSSSSQFLSVGKQTTADVWKPLRVKHRVVEEQADAKRKWERDLKEKWAKELYVQLAAIDAPILKGMDFCIGADRIHLALAGKTRSSTLKRYVKAWKAWQFWKKAAWGDEAFVHPGMFCEYLFSRMDEPCGPSIPGFICKAVNWFEKLAGLDEASVVTSSRAVIQIRDYITEQLSKDSPPPRRAPRYPAVVIEALECMVLDVTVSICIRVLAWCKLLKILGGLRYDDLQKIKPHELHLTSGRLTTLLRVTKTSGPGKRVQELPVCISEHAFIWCAQWIAVGFDILKKHADFDRDYLVPRFGDDWNGFRKRYATYADMTAYSTFLRKTLIRQSDWEMLIPEDLATFWTEHSERATFPTGIAMLGVQTTDRNLIGRWKPDASDSYVRSYNGLVANLQLKFAKALRKPNRTKILDEVDILESAGAWLRARRTDIAKEECDHLVSTLETSLAYYFDASVNPEPFETDPDDLDLLDLREVREQSDPQINRVHREAEYIVVHVNNRCKRLHKIKGGCWMARERTFKTSEEFMEKPSDTCFTHVCRVCWPDSKGADDSTEDTSSSSSSSDSEDTEEAGSRSSRMS